MSDRVRPDLVPLLEQRSCVVPRQRFDGSGKVQPLTADARDICIGSRDELRDQEEAGTETGLAQQRRGVRQLVTEAVVEGNNELSSGRAPVAQQVDRLRERGGLELRGEVRELPSERSDLVVEDEVVVDDAKTRRRRAGTTRKRSQRRAAQRGTGFGAQRTRAVELPRACYEAAVHCGWRRPVRQSESISSAYSG